MTNKKEKEGVKTALTFAEEFWKSCKEYIATTDVKLLEPWFETLLPDQIAFWIMVGYKNGQLTIENVYTIHEEMKKWNESLKNILDNNDKKELEKFEKENQNV